MKNIFITLFILCFFAGCSKPQGRSVLFQRVVIEENKFIVTGKNLDQVKSAKIKKDGVVTLVGFKTLSPTELHIEVDPLFKLSSKAVLDFIFSSASASTSFSLDIKTCSALLSSSGFDCTVALTNGDVLTFDGFTSKWNPKALGELPIKSQVTANYLLGDADAVVTANASGGALTLTLPSAVGILGRQYTLKKVDSSVNAVTVATTSAQLVEGQSTYILRLPYEYISVISNGAGWTLVSTMGELTSCPDGMIKMGSGRSTYCIDKVVRGSANYAAASNSCLNAGLSLCTYHQYTTACAAGGDFVRYNGEYGVESLGGVNANALMMGMTNCYTSTNTGGYYTNSQSYRCCVN